ncbi:PEGA domain-containing protein [candidate division WOR-3 bacterium]|nr:PEGA domain-containing protein [candidate division WOR-3 bacterium]
MHHFISNLEWAFKRLLVLLAVFLTQLGYAKLGVQIDEFELRGSGDVIISPAEMTQLLWRDLEADERFQVYYDQDEIQQDSVDFTVSGGCLFEGEDYFELNWEVTRLDNPYYQQFSFKGNGLKIARQVLYESLDSMLAVLLVTTNLDSVEVFIDGFYYGQSPLTLKDIPLGWHLFETTTPEGKPYQDSFYLTRDSTFFFFTIPVKPQDETAYLEILSPPRCELYVNGVHLPATYNQIYKLSPGEAQVHLFSPQYGTRNLKVSLVAGDTIQIGFFSPEP